MFQFAAGEYLLELEMITPARDSQQIEGTIDIGRSALSWINAFGCRGGND